MELQWKGAGEAWEALCPGRDWGNVGRSVVTEGANKDSSETRGSSEVTGCVGKRKEEG